MAETPQTTRQHPFAEGFDARNAGRDEYANPHRPGTPQADAWLDGWENADEQE